MDADEANARLLLALTVLAGADDPSAPEVREYVAQLLSGDTSGFVTPADDAG